MLFAGFDHHKDVITSQIDFWQFNTLRPRQNCRHFAGDIFKFILLNENVWISFKISLKFVPTGLINNIPALVQIMAWRRPGDTPLSAPGVIEPSQNPLRNHNSQAFSAGMYMVWLRFKSS